MNTIFVSRHSLMLLSMNNKNSLKNLNFSKYTNVDNNVFSFKYNKLNYNSHTCELNVLIVSASIL